MIYVGDDGFMALYIAIRKPSVTNAEQAFSRYWDGYMSMEESKGRLENVVQLYEEGHSYSAIAKMMDVNPGMIYKLIKKSGITTRKSKNGRVTWTDEQRQLLIDSFKESGQIKISDNLPYSFITCKKELVRLGLL